MAIKSIQPQILSPTRPDFWHSLSFWVITHKLGISYKGKVMDMRFVKVYIKLRQYYNLYQQPPLCLKELCSHWICLNHLHYYIKSSRRFKCVTSCNWCVCINDFVRFFILFIGGNYRLIWRQHFLFKHLGVFDLL